MEKTRKLKDLIDDSAELAKIMRINVARFLEVSCRMEHSFTTWTINGRIDRNRLDALRAQVSQLLSIEENLTHMFTVSFNRYTITESSIKAYKQNLACLMDDYEDKIARFYNTLADMKNMTGPEIRLTPSKNYYRDEITRKDKAILKTCQLVLDPLTTQLLELKVDTFGGLSKTSKAKQVLDGSIIIMNSLVETLTAYNNRETPFSDLHITLSRACYTAECAAKECEFQDRSGHHNIDLDDNGYFDALLRDLAYASKLTSDN